MTTKGTNRRKVQRLNNQDQFENKQSKSIKEDVGLFSPVVQTVDKHSTTGLKLV